MSRLSGIVEGHEIDIVNLISSEGLIPSHPENFAKNGITQVWEKYKDQLTWGKGQVIAIVDDGCDLTVPEWQVQLPWGPKVLTNWNTFDDNDDPTPVPPGYHGTSVGYPSSLFYNNNCGVAYLDQVIQIRSCTIVHLPQIAGEDVTLAKALDWVAEHAEEYNITAVNFSALDDKEHTEPYATVLDAPAKRLRDMGIWVSAPCGNNQHTGGISWPACQDYIYGIGSVYEDKVYNDRYNNTDILVHGIYTSSSNAYIVGSYLIFKEAVEKSGFEWQKYGANLPEAAMAIYLKTGDDQHDDATGLDFKSLNLLAAIDYVMERRDKE